MYLTGAAVTLIVLWWAAHHAPPLAAPLPADSAFPQGWDSPMTNVYAANPGAFLPPTDETLTLIIQNQLPSMLSDQYIPLFGFVGIAQGQMFL